MMAKTKILMLRNASRRFECSLSEGETGEVDAALADALIAARIAVPADVKGVPEKASVKAVTKPAAE